MTISGRITVDNRLLNMSSIDMLQVIKERENILENVQLYNINVYMIHCENELDYVTIYPNCKSYQCANPLDVFKGYPMHINYIDKQFNIQIPNSEPVVLLVDYEIMI